LLQNEIAKNRQKGLGYNGLKNHFLYLVAFRDFTALLNPVKRAKV
jgi:hypothetical protein